MLKMKDHSAIVPKTLSDMMGEDRWQAIMYEIFKEYKTINILIGHHVGGPKIYVGHAKGPCIGTVREVEEWAKKQKRERLRKIVNQ